MISKSFFEFEFWRVWIIIALMYFCISFTFNNYVYSDSYFYNSLSESLELNRINDIITLQHKFQLFGYLFIPIFLIIKLWVIAGVLFTGLYIFEYKIKYIKCLKIVLIAEMVSLAAILAKTAWLIAYVPSTENEIQSFSPLSITQLLQMDMIPQYLSYPLQLLNLFELVYWSVLVLGIMAFTQQGWRKSLKTVASSYGLALGIWIIFVVFIQLQFT